jgi:hypothetical protein
MNLLEKRMDIYLITGRIKIKHSLSCDSFFDEIHGKEERFIKANSNGISFVLFIFTT